MRLFTKTSLAAIGLTLLSAPAMAQYYDRYDAPRDDARYVAEQPVESVIVRPDYDYVEKRQLLGNINGERNPTAYTISRPVDFSDLDLASAADRQELRLRVHQTARQLCYQLDARFPQLRGDESADRECVRNATRTAMRDIYG
ncbi:MAG: UrcA family protein [Alphaproteobacteria bacterium]